MEESRQMICDRCRKSVLISDIRYFAKGKDSLIAVCSSCRAKNLVAYPAPKKGQEKKEESKRVSYVCLKCNYKFFFDPKSKKNLKCPYCGKADKLREDKPVSADNLIKESLSEGFL